ncbi:hypothetical protein P43SY_004509 [Pythium insidiosum]|uniref:Leucine-rich repeat-containing protein 51 n=1 Tax=Pythium insidiosum TaxID=114742 RepID=A0AAD5Q8U7_PYTIN|nr:hypothetical protein P43SY_004509 [Pythium insidiosum]
MRATAPATPLDYSFMGLSALSEMLQHDPVGGKKKGSGGPSSPTSNASSLEGPDAEKTTTVKPRARALAPVSLRVNNNKIAALDDMDDALAAVFDDPCKLQWLDLSGNNLTTIPKNAFAKYADLLTLHLHGNQLSRYVDIDHLAACLPRLHSLTLHGNPIEEKKQYRSYVIASFPQLKQLNFSSVTKGDRDKAETWARIHLKAIQAARHKGQRGASDGDYD